jgi:spore coat protein E
VTKAVVAKGKKKAEASETLRPPNNPSSILGCWVINHTHQAKKHGKFVEVTGKYDINVWYAHHDHSKTSVFSETVPYKERIKLHYREDDTQGVEDIHVRVVQQQIVLSHYHADGEQFKVTVESTCRSRG